MEQRTSSPYQSSTNTPGLSPKHSRMLFEESGITPDVAYESGVTTVRKGGGLPKGFSRRQRARGAGVLFTVHRPNGETSYSFRPDKPDPVEPGRKYEQPSKYCGGPGNVLGIHPSLHHLTPDTSVPVIWVEGEKKALSLVSAFRAAGAPIVVVAISGVWNWLSDGEPVADMFDIPVEGRNNTVLFDSDMLHNSNVQEAADRLARHLKERGADVFITYLEDQPDGSKTGADDFLAAGGTITQLRVLTRQYDPADFTRVRLSRSERLRAALAGLWECWEAMPTARQGECTDRATMREFIKYAERQGELSNGGVRVSPSLRTLALALGVSERGQSKSVKRLEDKGYIQKAPGPRKKKDAQAYILLSDAPGDRAFSSHNGEINRGETGEGLQGAGGKPDIYGNLHPCVNQTRAPREEVPELRNSKVVLIWERVGERWQVVDSEFIFRLGKKRGEILRYLVAVGGSASIAELVERFASLSERERPRDFRRRQLSHLEGYRLEKGERVELGPPIIEIIKPDKSDEPDIVRLTPKWRENLEEVRTEGKEQEDARRQTEKIARQRTCFHNPAKAGPEAELTPDLPAPEETARIVAEGVERDEASRIAEQWRKAGVTCELFVLDTLAELGRIRFGLLKEAWKDAGGNTAHLMPAIKRLNCNLRKLPEHQNTLHVFPPEDMRAARRSLAPHLRVVPDPGEECDLGDLGAEFERLAQSFPVGDDWVVVGEPKPKPMSLLDRLTSEVETEPKSEQRRGMLHPVSEEHPVSCECDDCLYPTPQYARPWRGK